MVRQLPARLLSVEPPLRTPRDRRDRFANYDGTVVVDGLRWAAPSSEAAVVRLMTSAAAGGGRIKIVGAGHSWSPIAAPTDVAVTLDGLSGVVGRGPGWVRVRAGTRLRQLYRALADEDESLPIVGSIAQQSVAGAVATGTHGSSLVHGNLSSLVLAARLVTGRGQVVDVGEGDDRLDALRVHLGALGAVTELTLRTVAAFWLAETTEAIAVERVGRRLEEIGRSAEFVKVWWMPHTARALIFRYERTGESTLGRPSPQAQRLVDNWLPRAVLAPIWALQRRRPIGVAALNRVANHWLVKKRRVGPAPLMLTTPEPIRHHETEAAVPLAAGGEAFDRTVALIHRLRVPVNFVLEARFAAADPAWMSTAGGRDVVHLGACTAITGSRREYFDAFWREMRPLGARPHWAKEMDHGVEEIRSLYPSVDRFNALRNDWDPGRVLANPFLERTLGP